MTVASEELVGKTVIGERTKKTFEVVEKLSVEPGQTPGQFSIGYRVRSSDGVDLFLKASDLGMFVNSSGSMLEALTKAATAHTAISCLRKARSVQRSDLVVNSVIFLVESLCRHSAITDEDVRFLESKITRAIADLSVAQQRDISKIYLARKRVWDELLNEPEHQAAVKAKFDTRLLEQELVSE
ncbi:MAG: hypothetical protein V4499_05370 [Pseudomonadota bacterium]